MLQLEGSGREQSQLPSFSCSIQVLNGLDDARPCWDGPAALLESLHVLTPHFGHSAWLISVSLKGS